MPRLYQPVLRPTSLLLNSHFRLSRSAICRPSQAVEKSCPVVNVMATTNQGVSASRVPSQMSEVALFTARGPVRNDNERR